MLTIEFLVRKSLSNALRLMQRLLRLDCQSILLHTPYTIKARITSVKLAKRPPRLGGSNMARTIDSELSNVTEHNSPMLTPLSRARIVVALKKLLEKPRDST